MPSGSTRYTYDARGNRTVKTPPTGAATNYTFNQNNQMTAVVGAATYAYDGDGLRMSKTLTGAAAKRMVWDRSTEIPNLLGDGTNTYIYGPDGAPLEQVSSTGVVTFLHHDQLGSTRLITSTSGANVASYTFDPYGNQTAKTGTATTPLGYAGQYKDAESGLTYMRARYYDSATGTFTSVDPLGSAGSGQNLYGYVGGDSVNFVDSSGLYGVKDLVGDVTGTVSEVPNTVQWWGQQAVENPGTTLAIGAGMACVFLSAGICVGAIAVQGAVGLGETTYDLADNPRCWRSSLLQAGLAVFPGGFAKGITKVGSKLITPQHLPNEFARAGVRAYATAPWVALTGLAGAAGKCGS